MAHGSSRVLACAIGLAGCGGGGQEAALPPTYFDRAAFGVLTARPASSSVPQSGSASYEGDFVADIRQADVTPTGRIEGGLTLGLDFAPGGTTQPVEGRLHDITGEFLGAAVAIDALPLVPGNGRLVLMQDGGRRGGAVEAGFGAELPLAGETRRLDIAIDSPLRGAGGRALAGPVTGTILTAPFTDQPHVLAGQFHATAE
jgi:hypothetical protein